MNRKLKPPGEWFKQADYDLGTADDMLKSGRYIYTIFMCHLSIEKALKGLYTKKFEKEPSKVHNLNYFLKELGLALPQNLRDFVDEINTVSVPTRYPDEIEEILKHYKKAEAATMLQKTRGVVEWLRKNL